jgi:hypothetical protein
MDQWRDQSRIGAVSAICGAVLFVVGTYLHLSKADQMTPERHLLNTPLISCG